MRIVFRVDASLQIGTGHFMRCATLAERLRHEGASVSFICRDLPGSLCEYLAARNVETHCLPTKAEASVSLAEEGYEPDRAPYENWLGVSQEQDASDTHRIINELNLRPDWLVVDHYALDIAWERELRPYVKKIMVIDDLANRSHDCDLLLDHNLQKDGRYSGHIPAECCCLIGPRYALLRPQFAAARQHLRARDGRVSRVLVFFGGADAGGETLKALSALAALDRSDLVVDVIIGQTNPHRRDIASACRSLPNTTLHCQVEDMATRMAEADLFLGAGGTSSLERCCVGLPAVVLATAENQISQSQALACAGAQIFVGPAMHVTPDSLSGLLDHILRLPELVSHISEQARALVDGRGSGRVADHILNNAIHLRRAEFADCENIYGWRNHPDTRRFSFDARPIDLETHKRWFTALLDDPSRELLIAENDGQPLGVLRYDVADERALVSIYLLPGLAGQGWGRRILLAGENWLRTRHPALRAIEAEISADNAVSLAAFRAAGYEPYRSLYRKEIHGSS